MSGAAGVTGPMASFQPGPGLRRPQLRPQPQQGAMAQDWQPTAQGPNHEPSCNC